MRSIIHEASTIAKAIEQGWTKAGKPKDFTVKIFEEPQKNFLGFTTKNAKVGIFIEDKSQQRQEFKPKKHIPHHRRQQQQRHRGRQWAPNHERDRQHKADQFVRDYEHQRHQEPEQRKQDHNNEPVPAHHPDDNKE